MIDTHCHLGLYESPLEVAATAGASGVLVIAVTNLPSEFVKAYPHVRALKHVRLALGLHPLAANEHSKEKAAFLKCLTSTSYIGEIGLDFSPEGFSTRTIQEESFVFALSALGTSPRFITVHSRRAEMVVLDYLRASQRTPVVFHWYTGSLKTLDLALDSGHYFSVNPAMVRSPKGKTIVARIPRDRILTETDGPFVKNGNRAVVPADVSIVESELANAWDTDVSAVSAQIRSNFRVITEPILKRQV
jgi:TatD DNase family protein